MRGRLAFKRNRYSADVGRAYSVVDGKNGEQSFPGPRASPRPRLYSLQTPIEVTGHALLHPYSLSALGTHVGVRETKHEGESL